MSFFEKIKLGVKNSIKSKTIVVSFLAGLAGFLGLLDDFPQDKIAMSISSLAILLRMVTKTSLLEEA